MRAGHLIVAGSGFSPCDDFIKHVRVLKQLIAHYMARNGFGQDHLQLTSYQLAIGTYEDPFLSLSFTRTVSLSPPQGAKLIWAKLGLLDKDKYERDAYFDRIAETATELPFEVKFFISPLHKGDAKGALVEIKSIPVAHFKLNRLNSKLPINEFKYSAIIESNKDFVYSTIAALAMTVEKSPTPLVDPGAESYTAPLADELSRLGFVKASKMLNESITKLKTGKVKEALDELRGLMEHVTYEVASRNTDAPHRQDKIDSNLNLLKDKGVLNKELCAVLVSISTKTYSYISDKASHKREDVTERDGELIYSIVEIYIKYLIDKTVVG